MYYIQELCSPTSAKSKRTPVRSPKDSCRTTRNKRQKMERPLFTNHRWFIAFQLLALLSMPTVISGTGSCTSLLTSPYSSMFSASTVSEGPGAPVINGTDVWCAGVVDEYQYLIVDLGKEMSIDRVAIQGYPGTTRSVSSYTLYTKRDGVYSSFQPVKVGYKIKLFQGSLMNGDSVKISDLPHTVTARYVKFNPREPLSPGSNDLCLRVDIQECSPVPIDGSWSEWSSWGVCTQDCLGVSTRYRTCDNPAPAHGGQSCIGQYSERKFCYNCPSPVDGDWSDWSPWSSCSASCDTGSATRTRSCTNPAPAHGGNDCVGSASEAGDCFVKNCPVHGDWSRWSPWSVCTLTCGGGIQFRSRACDNPIPEHGGNLCPGSSFEQTACNDQHCPIHGQWSDWGAWSSCGASCGGGTQSRSRACDNPAPQYGGLACSGTSSEIQQCNTHFCPIDGDWSAWSSWTTCDKTCGGGKTSRTRTCSNPAPQHGGSTCPGSTSQTLDCNTQSCPIHGGWSSWSSWSSCSKSCDGIQSRSRLCNSPPPDFGGSPCVGSPSDTQHCNLDVCPDPIDGGWSVWGMWSQCSQPCYGGSRSRSRDCTSPPPMHGGKNCQGNSVMREDCKHTCPVIGEWSSWSQWSSCSETCGSGTKFRRRTCTNPPPSHGGVDCSGQNSDYMACKDRDCPVDGQYSSWTQWTSCNVTCGGGSRVRDRKCDNPPPSSGGKACVGGNFQVEICNNNVCPVDGVWSSWSSWSSCDKVCGGGSQYRSRSCNNPKPASGGQPCTGKSVENQICNTNKCPLDGAWTNWSDGPCSVTCGQGKRNRTRTCTDPSPSGGGQPCPSVSYKTEDCNSGPCPSTAAPPTGTTPKVNAGIPEIDLVFVINVGGVDGAATFQLIKNSIKSIASIYGLARIRYGVVLYGSVATTRIDFSTSFTDLRSFKNAIDSLRANSAGSNLGEALEIAKELFSGPGARPNSKKVIVVIGNQTPVTDSSRLTSLAKTLSLLGIKIVSVGIGDSINLLKFQEIATRGKANLLSVDINISAVILGERIMRLVLIDDIPEIDLVFALSATSANKTETYTLMKETIKQIIDRYGTDKIQYSVIVFGSGATTIIYFNHTFPVSPAALKAAVDALPSTTGGPALDTALEEAKRLFDQIPVSSDGQKILVIIADKKSNLGDSVLTTAVRPLENQGILVISVGIGSEIDSGELKVLSPNPLDVIIASIYENPAVLAVRIMERVLRIRTPFLDLGFAMSATSVNSDAIFSLMKEIIKAIIDRYGTDKVHISVIVYGNVTTRSFNFGSAVPDQDQLKKDVDNLKRVPGPPNLEDALREARRLFQAITVRANAKKVFVVLTDSSRTQDVNSLRRAAANLRRDGILILTAGFGDQVNQIGNQMRVLTITPTDYIGVPNYNTERPVVIAEAIMYKATLANIPEIDLTFALSATSASADRTFTLMQRTVNKVVEEYGINRIHYSIIVFGRVTTTPLDFSRTLPNKEVLSNLVNRLQRNPGRPDLVRALEEVNRIYQLQPVRPNALKVLVVIMDNPTISDASSLNRVVTVLVNRSVIIIGVGVGPSVNRTELEIITREVQNVIRVNVNKDANELAREIIQLILRTSGFSQWGQWGACSRTCRYLGVAGRQVRRRTCRNAALGCVGSLTETRQCNEVDCFGCGKTEGTFTASSSLDQNTDATVAGLNTTNPSASRSAWCSRLNDDSKYIQLDLVQAGQVYQVASKGKEEASQLWVTAYYVSYSTDGTTFTNYTENGQLRVFSGNSDATSVVVNSLNITDGVSQVRFHPLRWEQQQTASPCMQVAVFACTVAGIGPTAGGVGSQQEEAGEGVLIALWILAGILTFLLLLACLWYCCRLCCGRGKKRKRFTSFRDTSTDTGYLLDQEKKWKLGQGVTGALKDRAHHEDEVQEVTVEMKEEAVKPGGVIQFGIETEEAKVGKDKFITAETVHSETPYYSEDVGTIKSGASMMTVGSDDTGYRSTERRKRIKSETRASVGDVAATSEQWSHRAEQRSSAFTNGGYMRSQEWFAEPVAEARAMDAGIAERKVRRSQSLDELGAVDYNMFERRRASAQAGDSFGVQSGRGGYYRFDQSGRESVDTTDGSFGMGTVDVAIGGLGDLDMGRRSSRPYAALDEQEMMTFRADNGGRSVYTLDNGGYHTEEWYTRGGVGPGQMREEGFKEIHVEHTPIYTDAQGNNQGFVHVRRV